MFDDPTYDRLYQAGAGVTSVSDGGLGMSPAERAVVPAYRKRVPQGGTRKAKTRLAAMSADRLFRPALMHEARAGDGRPRK